MNNVPIPFTGASYQARSPNQGIEQTLNLYQEITVGSKGQPKVVLYNAPGKFLFSAPGQGPTRGVWISSLGNKMWEVIGNVLYEILLNGSFQQVGTLATNTGFVYMMDNGSHLFIVDGSSNGYILTINNLGPFSSGFATVPDSNFVGGDSCEYVDGYFFVNQPGTNILQASNPCPFGTAPTNWTPAVGPLAIFPCPSMPNRIVRIIRQNRTLVVFGDFTTEVFYDASNATGFPFSRIDGGIYDVGLSARAGVGVIDNQLIWPAKTRNGDRYIVASLGYGWTRISNYPLESNLAKMPDISDAEAITMVKEGHSFYVLSFTLGNQTVVYDVGIGAQTPDLAWSERQSYPGGRDRARGCVFFGGMHVVGDYLNGTLGILDNNTYTEYGWPIIKRRRTAFIKQELNNCIIHELVLDQETGVGIQTATPGSLVPGPAPNPTQIMPDPQAMLRSSRDGGHTWQPELWASIGREGEYDKRVLFQQLGMGPLTGLELTISDPVKVAIGGAYASIEKLSI